MSRARPATNSRNPILVTGVPRSGTTWLARTLATASGAALAGREPMNPRGRQYGLGRTLQGWTRLEDPNRRQIRLLRSSYRGNNPLVLSRYGYRQWAAPLPWTQVIVKDPFAMLSLPAVAAATQALPVLIYRHPGAVLSSYRRMGWTADLEDLKGVVSLPDEPNLYREGQAADHIAPSDVADMARFWVALNQQALADLEHLPRAVVVSHHDISTGNATALKQLVRLCGLPWKGLSAGPRASQPHAAVSVNNSSALHNFNRAPAEVAQGWRKYISEQEASIIEDIAGPTLQDLDLERASLV
ncbi:sulfotransferase [Arthrobacter castelli]|uniref:sulfotransferase n=1 Tax=Arthrobacter castelli TaxID=271431 RepID=UPI001FDFB95F|nr:sulfotransferase [Arthrobacter castelli]